MRRGLNGWAARNFVDESVDLVETVQSRMHKYGWALEGEDKNRLWHAPDLGKCYLEGRLTLGNWLVDQDGLSAVCGELLTRPWLRVDELEWAVVSALVFGEVFEFGESVKKGAGSFSQARAYYSTEGNLRKMGWAKLKTSAVSWTLRWGMAAIGMWGAWYYVENNHYEGWGSIGILFSALLVLIWFLVGVPIGWCGMKKDRQKQIDLLVVMHNAHFTMKSGGLFSPYQIRSELLVAQEKGAGWPSAVFAVLDRAAMRDPPVWTL